MRSVGVAAVTVGLALVVAVAAPSARAMTPSQTKVTSASLPPSTTAWAKPRAVALSAYRPIGGVLNSKAQAQVDRMFNLESTWNSQTTARASGWRASLYKWRVGGKVLPALNAVTWRASWIGTAGYVGWKIGRTIDEKWLKLTPAGVDHLWSEAESRPEITDFMWEYKTSGQFSGSWVLHYYDSGGSATSSIPNGCCGGPPTSPYQQAVFAATQGLGFGTWVQIAAAPAFSVYRATNAEMEAQTAIHAFEPFTGQAVNVTTAWAPASHNISLVDDVEFGSGKRIKVGTETTTDPQFVGQRDAALALSEQNQDDVGYAISSKPEVAPDGWADGEDAGYVANSFTAPDCRGMDSIDCLTEWEQAAGEPIPPGNWQVEYLTWAEADLEVPAGMVVTTDPAGGAVVEHNVGEAPSVVVYVNPDPLPVEIPLPLPNETYTAYITRLQALGLVGQAQVLPDGATDPGVGPDAVSRTAPAVSSRVATGTTVTVWHNPAWAAPAPATSPPPVTRTPPPRPEVGTEPSSGDDCPCSVRGFDLTPLVELDGGGTFPWGVFSWVSGFLGQFNVTPDAPVFAFDLAVVPTPVGDFNLGAYNVDLAVMDSHMQTVRTLLSFVMWAGAIWWVATRLLGFRGTGDPGAAVDEVV